MRDPWSFHNPVRIHAGAGALRALPDLLMGTGPLLIVTTKGFRRRDVHGTIDRLLATRDSRVIDDVAANPDLAHVEAQVRNAARGMPREIVAIGGGSVLDTAKLIAASFAQEGFSLRAHLLDGVPLAATRATRLLCVPTTAGTGSEVTPFATVWDHAGRRKYSVAGDVMFPDVALLDAELTLTLPEEQTISTGLDAITQAFEGTWSRRANRVTTALAAGAIRLGLEALPRLRAEPANLALRGVMLEASLLAGLTISHTRTALCHSMSYPITAALGVPHGLACGFTLPEVFAFNRAAAPDAFEALARQLGFHSAGRLHERLLALMRELDVGGLLRRYVDDAGAVLSLAPEMLTPGRADNNAREAGVSDVVAILEEACRGRGLTASVE